MIMLSGIATVTTRMRLVTTLLLSPLRPALLLAKQAATLDVLCNGRFDLGAVSYTHLDVYKRQVTAP